MITKTAITAGSIAMNGLFALPHAIGFHNGEESAGAATLNTAGDIAALTAGDALYNKIMKPKDYAFLGRNQTSSGLVRKSRFFDKFRFKYKGPFLAKHWGRAFGHGLGRMLVGIPLLTASNNILTPLGDKLLPYRHRPVNNNNNNGRAQYVQK